MAKSLATFNLPLRECSLGFLQKMTELSLFCPAISIILIKQRLHISCAKRQIVALCKPNEYF